MKSKNKYFFPVKDFAEYGSMSPAHIGKSKHAIDFTVPEGTPIYAALARRIVYTKSSSKVSGNNKKYRKEGNGVIIRHANDEYSLYWHLKFKGVKVKKGQIVRAGRIIGFSGNTGWSHKPHLHFEVYDKNRKSLKIRFSRTLNG